MPAASRPTVLSLSAWNSCRSSSRVGLLGRARLEPRAPARLLDREAAEQQRERHHAEVERERRAVAGEHRLGGHRGLLLAAGEAKRHRGAPALGPQLARARRVAGLWQAPRREAAQEGARCVAQLAARTCSEGSGSPGSSSAATSAFALQPDARHGRLARLACGSRTMSASGADRPRAPSSPVGLADAEHRHAATAADVHERQAVARADADAHDFRVAAQEQEQRALGGLARERGSRPRSPRRDARSTASRADEGEVRADLESRRSRRAARARTSCSKLPRAASRSPWRATWIPQRPAALTATTASSARSVSQRAPAQSPAGAEASGLRTGTGRRGPRRCRCCRTAPPGRGRSCRRTGPRSALRPASFRTSRPRARCPRRSRALPAPTMRTRGEQVTSRLAALAELVRAVQQAEADDVSRR